MARLTKQIDALALATWGVLPHMHSFGTPALASYAVVFVLPEHTPVAPEHSARAWRAGGHLHRRYCSLVLSVSVGLVWCPGGTEARA